MKHLRKFNEASEETVTFKNTDEDIQLFFTDYSDDDPNALWRYESEDYSVDGLFEIFKEQFKNK